MKAVALFLFAVVLCIDGKLRVQGNDFYYNNQHVFLSGSNVAWQNYGSDFGSGAYAGVKSTYQSYIDQVAAGGGNVIRVWVHIDGRWSPKFDASGTVTGQDTQSLISELGQLLDYAAQKNVFVIPVLWSLAIKPTKMLQLYTDEVKLQSYLDRVLRPLAAGLRNKPALAAYEIINEPMGAIALSGDTNPCFNTLNLNGTGTDWSGAHLNIRHILRFINRHIGVIKSADPGALVTIGDHAPTSSHVLRNYRDYYADACLISAGGNPNGKMDFYQLHSYVWPSPNGKFPPGSPFLLKFANYRASKPMIIGEFSTVCSESKNPAFNYQYLYNAGYDGALNWQLNGQGGCSDSKLQTLQGYGSIKNLNTNGRVLIKL